MEKKKTPYQYFCIKLLEVILNDEEIKNTINTTGIKQVIKYIIRHYPEITEDNKTTWKKVDMYKKYFKISERGVRALEINNNWKDVHCEHIYPVSQVYNDLVNLSEKKNDSYISKENIEEILNKSEIIVLSKEEAKVLDGSQKEHYELEGEMVKGKGLKSKGDPVTRLQAIGAKIDERYKNNKLI